MDRLDRLIKKAKEGNVVFPYLDYDYSRLTTEELYELISDDITEERIAEIMEPVKFMSTDGNSTRKKLERLSFGELEEMAARYERINQE